MSTLPLADFVKLFQSDKGSNVKGKHILLYCVLSMYILSHLRAATF